MPELLQLCIRDGGALGSQVEGGQARHVQLFQGPVSAILHAEVLQLWERLPRSIIRRPEPCQLLQYTYRSNAPSPPAPPLPP